MDNQKPEIYDTVSSEYSICTLPRVGSFYLQDRIFQHTGVYIKKYHSLKNNKMITIIRDPFDMLTSKLAMTVFYEKDDKTINDIKNNKITKDLEEYLSFINQVDISSHPFIFIDYEDLTIKPIETIQALASIINLPIINKNYKENTIKDYAEYSHLVSSKKSEQYEEIKSYVEAMDLSNLYDFYDKTIAKCIKI
jgi:hypothetical protein